MPKLVVCKDPPLLNLRRAEVVIYVKEYKPYLVWLLIIAGVLWGYEGLVGTNLLVTIFGLSVASIVEIIVGIAALIVAYLKLTAKGKK